MLKRIERRILTNISDENMNEALAAYIKAEASIAKINADLDLKFSQLRDEKADELAKLEAEKNEAFYQVQTFALQNKETQFSKKKSIDLSHSTIGFRMSTPKIKILKGFTEKAVTKLLERLAPEYVRKTVEIDREKLIANRNKEGMKAKMKDYGVEVVRDETFYIELKKEIGE